jgi:SpoVK/Ycf46/Vps4 family AAA+-type ATPase
LYFIQKLHEGKNTSDFKHTVIYGPPGTGKTEIAEIIGTLYSKLGILKKNVFKKVTRSDMVAGYLGQTAIKTTNVIQESLGGVLFIDEAYSLASDSNDSNDSYSKECLDTLCEALSNHKDDLMVIIAGYEDELNNTFFRVNKGLDSRFIWRFYTNCYTGEELSEIYHKKMVEQEWTMNMEKGELTKWLEQRIEHYPHFGRDMELLLMYTKIVHSRRIYGKPDDELRVITIDDLTDGHELFTMNKKKQKNNINPASLYAMYV